MTDKVQKILAKIELLLNETNYEPYSDEVLGRIKSLKELKSYIDSLQEEPVNDKLHEFEKEFFSIVNPYRNSHNYKGICVNLINWQHNLWRWLYWKENKKGPVSEKLEVASKEWLSPQLDKSYAAYGNTKQMELTHFDGYAMLDAIEFGAEWKEEQFEKNRLAHCDAQTEEEAEIERDFVMGIIENEHRQPTFDDAIKYGMRLQKQQMIKDAVDGWVFRCMKDGRLRISDNKECWNGIRIPEKSIEKSYLFCTTDDAIKVKLVIVKED